MKLIYIANARIPTEKAHGIQIMKMCEAFALCDNADVTLIVPRRFNSIKEDPFDYYGVSKNFQIKKLPCLDLIIFDKYIGYLGIWIESLSFNFFSFFNLLFKKADIFYTRDKFFLPFCLFKRNLVFEAHTFPRNYFLYILFIKRLRKIVVITQSLKQLFIKKSVNSEKILVASDGVDLDKFNIEKDQKECREKLNLPLDRKIVLYAGHLYKWKGVQCLAEASQNFSEDVKFYFVGGTVEDIKKFRVKNLKLSIKLIGHRPQAEMPYWLKAADVLVLPNTAKTDISRYWTSPMKMFEYMASNRPIVASDLPSIREILNKDNAVLVEPDNPAALAEGLRKALQNPEFSAKISNQAFQDVKEYTWQRRVKNILNFIKLNPYGN